MTNKQRFVPEGYRFYQWKASRWFIIPFSVSIFITILLPKEVSPVIWSWIVLAIWILGFITCTWMSYKEMNIHMENEEKRIQQLIKNLPEADVYEIEVESVEIDVEMGYPADVTVVKEPECFDTSVVYRVVKRPPQTDTGGEEIDLIHPRRPVSFQEGEVKDDVEKA